MKFTSVKKPIIREKQLFVLVDDVTGDATVLMSAITVIDFIKNHLNIQLSIRELQNLRACLSGRSTKFLNFRIYKWNKLDAQEKALILTIVDVV